MTPQLLHNGSSQARRRQVHDKALLRGAQIIGTTWERLDKELKKIGFADDERKELLLELHAVQSKLLEEVLE